MKTLLPIAILLTATVAISSAQDKISTPDRPPGIAADTWVQIGDGFGLVVTSSRESASTPLGFLGSGDLQALIVFDRPVTKPPVDGYFVAKVRGEWRRVAVQPPFGG